jgi:outer membrane protein assembly factor BamB
MPAAVSSITSEVGGGGQTLAAGRGWVVALVVLAIAVLIPADGRPETPTALDGTDEPAAAADDQEAVEPGVFLPGDRGRERQLDRARRLIADERWSDAAVALDELLAIDRDAFVTASAETTRGSIRSAAAASLAALPRPGRDAYHTLFDARAAKQLAAAIAADDHVALVAVARRWLHTPAGRQAALLAAVTMLESGQPLAASAWLERLAGLENSADLEPSLSTMRAVARYRAGDEPTAARLLAAVGRRGRSSLRLGGRDLALPPGPEGALPWLAAHAGGAPRLQRAGSDWRQIGGGPTRAGVAAASRPLLVPRYRVPLVRHPEEARRLEQARRTAADAGAPLLPAGTPLAVGNRLVVDTPLGILAIDFETGRRVWLESAVTVAEVEQGDEEGRWPDEGPGDPAAQRAFIDATSGNLASDGRLVFAVESSPEALAVGRVSVAGFGRGFNAMGEAEEVANTLSAYELAAGTLAWRLPAGPRPARDSEPVGDDARRWHMGPPLVVGDELFVLVEDRGEVSVETRAAADGSLRWSQPLATFDEGDTIASLDARGRRLAGLTPAFDEGVLVCPIGAGCVVAVDVAARSLLWAHAYRRPPAAEGMGMMGQGGAADEATGRRGGEPAPIIAGGRVVLAPFDSDFVICLGLRDGKPAWRRPRAAGTRVAGVTDARVITVGDTAAEAIDLATGRPLWNRGLGEGVRPSGRSLLTPQSLLVPCDAAAVIEIALADGRILGRSTARGGRIPGNLVAHRGEVISRTVDSLDVFHQEAALEERIETAGQGTPDAPWVAYWRGQAAIESGDVAAGLASLAQAAGAPGFRIPPSDLDEAFVTAMRRDFATAAAAWATFPGRDPTRAAPAVGRMAIDGFLAAGDAASAWASLEPLLTSDADAVDAAREFVTFVDPADPALSIAPDRWIQGRLARVSDAADAALRRRIDTACAALVSAALTTPEPVARRRRVEVAHERLGRHPAAEALGRERASPAAANGDVVEVGGWPLGQVEVRRARDHHEADAGARPQLLPVPLAGGGAAGTRAFQAAIDMARERILISDAFGRPVTDSLPVEGLGNTIGMPFFNQVMPLELAVAGRSLFVRSTAGISAYDLEAEPGSGRGLWRQPEFGTEVDDRVRWGGGAAGRVARDGAAPLGMRIMEPADRPRGGGRGMVALPTGLVVPGTRSVAMLDPTTGRVLWERHRLPPGLEWFVDEEFLCGCTVDGRGSVVCQATDGRLLHMADVPHRRQRVAAQGRRFIATTMLDDHPASGIAERVRLDLVDPVDRETRPLGEFAGAARATATEDGRLAVLEPGGRLTLFAMADGSLVFDTTLAEMPSRMERLSVQAWQDRYLVLAGASDDEPADDVTPLEQFLLAGGAAAPLSAAIWAVDRVHGRPLWPVPALVERHCLHPAQPPGLPVLTFCRLLQRRGSRQPSLSVLCLDKRTGHAVFESDRVEPQAPMAFGCNVAGDPKQATITLGDARPLELSFTGLPLAPRPPFRGRSRPLLHARGFPE